MKTTPVLKRRSLGITDYQKRYRLLKSDITRAVVRPTNKGMVIEFVDYNPSGDVVRVTVTDKSLQKEYGVYGNNIQSMYLAGYLAGKKASEKGIKSAILDTGRYKFIHGGRLAAALKGIVDSGIEIPAEESVFPDESRINGEHLKNRVDISKYVKKGE
ncbi:MAG: 50S ribosomal protein L18 [Candidatus Thermoplasmatota archaeon]|jgi:large subunit ribosomal protein L18|uniref:50S ribosomal protein L18 n=1 Tax=Ferroplasma sp. TaxID=2591003 RepID=UPI0026231035|nr:50S ribosomal protein L18 [Ferroplasma sp.]MCL4311711.1 50S ribosomal protein L18 [Candidatus Thermoplasmatota archaeon]